MATAYKVKVSASDTGLLKFKQDEATAQKVSDLLQQDLERHHVFFNASGFHDHIVHQLLTLYGTGASAQHLQKAYDDNSSYMKPAQATHDSVLEELRAGWHEAAPKYLGKGNHYPDFLAFFQREIETRGFEEVLLEYVFKGDEVAESVYARLFAGILHPIIQLLFGLEWSQPAIIASALAQTCVHKDNLRDFLTKAETLARADEGNQPPAAASSPTMLSLYEELRLPENEKLARSARFTDELHISGGVFARAYEEAARFASRIRVDEAALEERTAEMVHASALVAAAAAWKPPHEPKYDFFLIHHLTSAPVFLTFNKYPWLPQSSKARLLEWKLRLDAIEYIARGCPALDASILSAYVPRDDSQRQDGAQRPEVSDPEDLLPRVHGMHDDGHIVKVARSLLIAREASRGYEDKAWHVIKEGDYARMMHMLLDGATGSGGVWVRSAGFDEAWKDIPNITWKVRL
ncbi:hypothetical protein N3K66_006626 [Trichothecium roseum]|uniref:Uncharacterized protein n=1 Tax=Trichothecium roseum TaxID=47278 RepID=A0ACC0UVW4_9HYPO|nr:hypothetical protein N3K66_006626 [Trichothecium roseum]